MIAAASAGDGSNTSMFSYKPQDRIVSKIKELEYLRSKKLQEGRVIGRVTNKKSEVSYHINTRKVNFHWQKGNKIGNVFIVNPLMFSGPFYLVLCMGLVSVLKVSGLIFFFIVIIFFF